MGMLSVDMFTESPFERRSVPAAESGSTDQPFVSEESLVLRNYDSETTHEVGVRFLDAEDETAFRQTFTLAPQATVSVCMRLPRAVYRVEVDLDDCSTSAECLVGSGPDETALVEVGNGLVSVAEGVF